MPSNHSQIQWSDTPAEDALCDRIRTLETQRDELLAALERLHDWSILRSDWLAAGRTEPPSHPIQEARAAIRKAKGEEEA